MIILYLGTCACCNFAIGSLVPSSIVLRLPAEDWCMIENAFASLHHMTCCTYSRLSILSTRRELRNNVNVVVASSTQLTTVQICLNIILLFFIFRFYMALLTKYTWASMCIAFSCFCRFAKSAALLSTILWWRIVAQT